MFPEEFGYPMDDSFGDYGGFNNGLGMGFNDYGYRVKKATNRDIQEAIAYQLGVDLYNLDLVKIDELPNNPNDWKHSCYFSGVTIMNVNEIMLDDGTVVYYGVCPFFPQCNKVHYYVEKPY